MLFTITGKHMEITDAIRSHAEEKVNKLPRYYNNISQVEVVLEGKEGTHPSVEILVHIEHDAMVVAKETGPDMYAVMDIAIHKIERQLTKKKEKQRNNKHISPAEIPSMEIPGEEDVA